MGVEALSADKFAELLRAQGVPEDQIEATAAVYMQAKYAPPKKKIKPTIYYESDKVFELSPENKITLRYMNGDDIKRIAPKIIQIAKALILEESLDFESAEDMLNNMNPMAFISKILEYVIQADGDDYPEWMYAAIEEIAILTSNPDKDFVFTPGDFVALRPSKQVELCEKLVEVNKADFFILWAKVPQKYRLMITTLASWLTNNVKRISNLLMAPILSLGTQDDTGNSSSSTPSKKPKATAKKKQAD